MLINKLRPCLKLQFNGGLEHLARSALLEAVDSFCEWYNIYSFSGPGL